MEDIYVSRLKKRSHSVDFSFGGKCKNFSKFRYKFFELLTLHRYISATNDAGDLVEGTLERVFGPLQHSIHKSILTKWDLFLCTDNTPRAKTYQIHVTTSKIRVYKIESNYNIDDSINEFIRGSYNIDISYKKWSFLSVLPLNFFFFQYYIFNHGIIG